MDQRTIKAHKEAVCQAIDQLKGQLCDLAARIHQHPEIKFQEQRAAAWLAQAAQEAGFQVEKPLAGLETAFRATYRGGGESPPSHGGPSNGATSGKKGEAPCIAFLAEYDALPKLGHACGHNLIGAASLGAALGLAGTARDLPACIQLIGTPAEEGGGGKVTLAEAKVFAGIDAAMMFHPSGRNILWKYALNRHKLAVEFSGKSAHASGSPEEGINALDAVIQTFNSINALREHVSDDARIHGIITDGGAAPNVVPDHAAAVFYIRALDDAYSRELLEKVKNCARGAALATGAEVSLAVQGSYKSLKPNKTLARIFQHNVEALGRHFETVDPSKKIGSTDMGDVSQVVPVIHPYLSIGPAEMAGHSVEFAEAAISERGMETMLIAAKGLATTALDLLLNSSLLKEIKAEFQEG